MIHFWVIIVVNMNKTLYWARLASELVMSQNEGKHLKGAIRMNWLPVKARPLQTNKEAAYHQSN